MNPLKRGALRLEEGEREVREERAAIPGHNGFIKTHKFQ
jgi:hypothetical protein